MAGQYQTDVIGKPFSGVETKNGSFIVSPCPSFGNSQTRGGKDDANPESVKNKLTGRFDDKGYY
jgi:hypothetical protein